MIKPHLKHQQTEDVVVMVKDKEIGIGKSWEAYLNSLEPKSIKHLMVW